MSTTTTPTLSGLARILSTQPMPLVPMFRTMDPRRVADEVEQYVRNLHRFLQDLFGKFTAEIINQTLINGGVGGFARTFSEVISYHGTDTPLVLDLDTGFDWREVGILCHMRIADTRDNLQHFVDDPDSVTTFVPGTNKSGDYPSQIQNCSDNQFLTNVSATMQISSTGKLQLKIDNISGGSATGLIFIFAGGIGQVPITGSVSAGNGL